MVLMLASPELRAAAQELTVTTYTAADGLANNLVKHVLQDHTGFIWIATDGGLVRFDGLHLSSFRVADGLPSNFVKSTFQDSRKRIFVVTDLGVAQAINDRGETRFTPILGGSTLPLDSLVFYPKTMFEDRNRNLWVADAHGVVRMSEGSVQRYPMPADSWPDSFVRTYSVLEDDGGHLIAISERGQVFVHHAEDDRFVRVETPDALTQVNAAQTRPDGSTWVAGAYGMYSFRLSDDHRVIDWRLISDQTDIMDFRVLPGGETLLATSGHGLLVLSAVDGSGTTQPYANIGSRIAHGVTADAEGTVFVATDNGLSVIRRSFFTRADNLKSTAIQSIAVSQSGQVFGVEEKTVFRLTNVDGSVLREPVFTADEVLTALATDGDRYWAGSANGTVFLFRSGTLTSFKLDGGRAVASMTIGSGSDVWVCQVKGTEIIRISVDGTIRRYGTEDGIVSAVNVVRYLDRSVLVGADGKSYLLRYDDSEDRFSDVSQPLSSDLGGGLVVNDVETSAAGNLWLATDRGLLEHSSSTLRRPRAVRELENTEIRALTRDRFGQVWIGTGGGIHRYTPGQLSSFSADPGVRSQTVHYRSVVVDSEQRVWAGYHGGVSFWNRQPGEVHVTPRPVALSVWTGGTHINPSQNAIEIPFGAPVEIDFVSLSYPGANIQYQARFDGNDSWGRAQRDAHLHFLSASPGTHGLEIRAQQGGYLWSPPLEVTVVIAHPWYRKWWAIALFALASAALIAIMWRVHDRVRTMQLRTRNEQLERLVTKRTKEINDQKKTIEQTNLDLKAVLERNHEFLGVAAHDLRNPLTSLIGFSELLIDSVDEMPPDEFAAKSGDVLPIIHRAATTMQGVIQDLLDSQLVERKEYRLRLEDTDFVQLVRTAVNMNVVASRRKGTTLTFIPSGVYLARVDLRSMQRVLDNLISNAVKYSPPGSEVLIRLDHTGNALRFSVVDRGPGLTEEDKSRVFGKLQRLSAKPTAGETSTGLGLYIARAVTEMHGGRIGVNSILGEGSEFWVEIPARDASAAAA